MSIGSRIAERRKELGMTQQDLAELVDVSFQAVSSWERDEYLPETNKLIAIANALSTKASWILDDEEPEYNNWILKDAMFSIKNMEKKVRDIARARGMEQTLKALRFAKKYHEGQYRKVKEGREEIDYIIHPLMIACHAFALGIADDNLVSACLLHDCLEDTPATEDDLKWLSEEAMEAVKLVTFEQLEGKSKEESKKIYYKKISKNGLASMVKLLDRCNNVSQMAIGFKKGKMAEYIDETEEYVLPLLEKVKHEYDEYYNATFLLKYQMLSVLETLKRVL